LTNSNWLHILQLSQRVHYILVQLTFTEVQNVNRQDD
jgi:hypothetical protein